MPKRAKKPKKKQKSSMTQTVNVYVTKRGGGGSKAPRQPTQAERMFQMISPLLAQRTQFIPQQIIQPPQPLVAPQQQLQNLQEQINQIANLQHRNDIDNPFDGNLSRSDSRVSLPSFAFDFGAYENLGNLSSSSSRSSSGQSFVLDQPDAPLVEAIQPLVSGAPKRLDPPHEDVPLQKLEEGKDQANDEAKDEVEDPPPFLSFNIMPPLQNITKQYLSELNRKKPSAFKGITLLQIARNYNIEVPRDVNKYNKDQFVEFLWNQIQQRKQQASMASSSSSS